MRLVLIFIITFLMVMDAGADPRDRGGWRGHDRGYGGPRYGNYYRRPSYDPSAAIGGAVGGWLWKQWHQPQEPQVIVVPQEPYRDVAWCIQRYRSYNPSTRTYLGYDGQFHACP